MIYIHYETNFFLEKETEKIIITWIKRVINMEKSELNEINYIFCNDDFLLRKNKKYLNHDNFTDIITFDYSEKDKITSDIMISIDRVRENSIIFEKSFEEELYRVMVHGVLHLLGYDDKTNKDKTIMRKKEDIYLNIILNN
tara:strand:- start:69560 stop:69982 length:423 start_codon:yes stop_codon:yes gene_type:complete